MQADDSPDGMLPEYDFRAAGRRRYAGRWSAEARESFLRDAAGRSAGEWSRYVRDALDQLVAALFAHQVLIGGESPRRASVRSRALEGERWERRLIALRAEREWAAGAHPESERLHGSGWVERMHRILGEAQALRQELEDEVRRHLANGGLSAEEIRIRTEATERLRRAA